MTRESRIEKWSRLGDELLIEQLRRKGYTIETAKAMNTEEKSTEWLVKIKWDNENEMKDFKKWAVDLIMKKMKVNKRTAEKQFSWWDLNYGLGLSNSATKTI